MKRRVRWQDLPYFLAVARNGSLTGAAKYLETNHATVGRHLQVLEEALGGKLFERGQAGYLLTPKGEHFLGVVSEMQSKLREALYDTNVYEVALSGILRIGVPEEFGTFFMAERLADFATQHNSLTLELISIPPMLSAAKLQGEITISHAPPPRGRFLTEHLTNYRMHCYATRSYLSKHGELRKPEHLSSHVIIGFIDDIDQAAIEDFYSEIQPGLKATIRYSSIPAQMAAAAKGYGICMLPAYAATLRPELVPVMPDQICVERSYYMYVHEDIAHSRRARTFRTFLKTAVEEEQALFLS